MVESVPANYTGVDLMNEAGSVDLCKDAFTAYTEANFKVCKE